MDHIYYSKNVLDAGTLNNLQELCLEKFKDIPTYNFARKTDGCFSTSVRVNCNSFNRSRNSSIKIKAQ